jgi:hypothetical protein
MHPKTTVVRAAIVALCLWVGSVLADERLWVEAKINGQPARLCFDTGTSDLILLRSAAKRLGVAFTEPPTNTVPAPGAISSGISEPCDLTVRKATVRTQFRVADLPDYVRTDIDGLIGWKAIKGNILKIDAERGSVTALANVPKAARDWIQIPVDGRSDYLQLEVPSDGPERGSIFVDTGWTQGVGLPEKQWSQWESAHALQPLTIKAYFMPGAGVQVKEEGWAKEVALGPITITNVPVTEAPAVHLKAATPPYVASLGLAGLKRLEFIVDGVRGMAYVRPKKGFPTPYQHNRLGAVFVPRDTSNDDLAARIVPGSPAEEVGIRNGDVLLRVGNLDVTKWRTDPKVLPLTRFWEQSPGNKLDLTLKRDKKIFRVNVTLRQILSPRDPTAKAGRS